MAESGRSSGRGIPIRGIFILSLGIILLLQTLNILPWDLWRTLWRFWPVIIILIGINILLGQWNPWLLSVIIMVVLLAVLGIAISYHSSFPGEVKATEGYYSQPLNNLEKVNISLEVNAGDLRIAGLPVSSRNLIDVRSDARNTRGNVRADYRVEGSAGNLKLTLEPFDGQFWSGRGFKWEAGLTGNTPVSLDIKSAASNINMDLSGIRLTGLQLEVNAGKGDIKMPSLTGTAGARMKVNAGSLEVSIPASAAARIKANTNLAGLEINEKRFPRKGEYYISDGYDTSAQRIDLEIEGNVGRVKVN